MPARSRYSRPCLRLGLLAACLASAVKADEPPKFRERVRRPVAMIPMADGRHLAVLNRRCGTISRLDLRSREVLDESNVTSRLAAGCALADGSLAVLDDQTNELIVVGFEGGGFQTRARQPVAAAPVNVMALPDGRGGIVASTWARRLTFFSWTPAADEKLRIEHTLDLPFAPRELHFLDQNRCLVADAFGGGLALVDIVQPAVIRCRELQVTHNITGMTRARDDASLVYLTHQMLNADQATTEPNVHWGDVMSNVVRRLDVDWFLSDRAEQTTAADLYYLGHPDSAAGDPQGILTTDSSRFIVAFGGVNQVAISDRGLNHFQRVDVGRRPLAMWLDTEHNELYVANHLDDGLSVIDLARTRVVATIALGPAGILSLADRGEQLFYDARLSSDGWYSCHSCHTDGHTNGRQSDTFGDGYRGAPKQVLSLLGGAETGPWAWNGKMPMLESQIRKSIETTMQGESPDVEQVQALAAFLMSLAPPPSLRAARGETDAAVLERGRRVFHEAGCADCHRPPTYTSSEVYDVGLVDADGERRFNPPSLRGVGHRRRWLHDGQADDLRAVLRIHPYGEPRELDDDHWAELEEFLLSL
jgi:YVTN family beta-propeller protein